jgi:hypothetical protein
MIRIPTLSTKSSRLTSRMTRCGINSLWYIRSRRSRLSVSLVGRRPSQRDASRWTTSGLGGSDQDASVTVIRLTPATRSRSRTGVRRPSNLRQLSGLGVGVLGRLRGGATPSGYIRKRQAGRVLGCTVSGDDPRRYASVRAQRVRRHQPGHPRPRQRRPGGTTPTRQPPPG